MHQKYIYSNLIGTFIFNEHFKVINKVLFKNIEDYNNREKFEKGLTKRYKNLKKPEGKELIKILEFFKNKEFFNDFYTRNLILTKKNIKESVKDDILIIQTINNIEDIDKVINTLTKNLREWYELYNPEFSKSVENHEKFTELILKKDKKVLLKEINKKGSMGADFSKENLEPVLNLARQINNLYLLRKKQEDYLESLMKKTCPNLTATAGASIGAKLLQHAGSLKRLMYFPASTIQVLGAEKALFRHMKTGAKPPRHGVIVQHPLLSGAPQKMHGKIARALADKISIAVKVDYFRGKFVGDKLRKGLEEKFK